VNLVIRAELRKILTTKIWWALLIPTALLAFGTAWGFANLTTVIDESLRNDPDLKQLDVRLDSLPIAVFGMARAIHLATIFPMVFGGLALASELRHRTITTSYLTAPNRATVLGGKGLVYALAGLLYGIAIVAFASLGMTIGALDAPGTLPAIGDWLLVGLAGILETTLWTMLAVGVGALLGNVVGTVLTLVLWSVLVENILWLVLVQFDPLPGFLINGSANGISGGVAADVMIRNMSELVPQLQSYIPSTENSLVALFKFSAGAGGSLDWYFSALMFAAWTALFLGLGWVRSRARDIT
jgi:ABC-2 type transport system permease protein